MKKFLLFMLGSAFLATSAIANNSLVKPEQPVKLSGITKMFTTSNLYGINGLSSGTLYITATNQSTSQSYYLTVYSTYPSSNSDWVVVPNGTYDISVSTSQYATYYLSDDDNVDGGSGYYHMFNNITINYGYSTVIEAN